MDKRRKVHGLQLWRAAVTVGADRARLDAAAAVEEEPRGCARHPTGVACRQRVLLAVLCAAMTIGWLSAERDRASEGNRLYDAGRYDEAGTAYGEGLVDYPESTRLRFNLAAAQYRQGNFADAVTTLEKLLPDVRGEGPVGRPPGKASELAAEAAYNIGNARYRMGKQAEEKDPQQAIALYEQALLAYKWAMALDPDDSEPKFNHEFVERQSKELKERLEKQQQERGKQEEGEKQQQEQAPQQPGDGEEQGSEKEETPKPDQEAGQGRQASEGQENAEQPESKKGQPDSERASQEQAQEESGGQQEESKEESQKESKGAMPEQAAQGQAAQEPAGAVGEAGAEPAGEAMTAAEARTLIDAARGEEVGPGEVRRQVGIAGVGEPVEDW